MDRFVILSGCSGGGKTTLLAELHRRGYTVVAEPGQRIVREATFSGGDTVPWKNMKAFLRRAITPSVDDHAQARGHGRSWVFFDRGLIDATVAEFERLQEVYPTLGYTVSLLPKASVKVRADFVLRTLADAW